MSIESLSALLDGELRPHELERVLAALERDPALRAQFDRLVAARAALQGTRVTPAAASLAGRVRAALAATPVAASPRRARPVPRLLWVPLAAAAAVAAVAIVAVRPEPSGPPLPAVAAVTPPGDSAAATAVPVSLPIAAVPAAEPAVVAPNEQLQRYLMVYGQARTEAGSTGALGLARVASQPPPEAAESR